MANHTGESHVFFTSNLDYVMSHDTVVHGTMNRISVLKIHYDFALEI